MTNTVCPVFKTIDNRIEGCIICTGDYMAIDVTKLISGAIPAQSLTVTTSSCPYTITTSHPPVDLPKITPPKCYVCGRDVQAVSSFTKGETFIIILKCHDDERRIDIALNRFKGNQEDAIEWFSDNFQWTFADEEKWRAVQPEPDVDTVHADRKIIADWLDKL